MNSDYKLQMGVIAAVLAVGLYFYLGSLPFVLTVALILMVFAILVNMITSDNTVPTIVLNDEGVFDKRLKVGVIRWEDIRRIMTYDLHGAHYISLELHDQKSYEARKPVWWRITSQVQRVFGISAMAISTNGLQMDQDTLVMLIHQGCQEASQRNAITG